ncbi:MAG TPA: winged helix-turn-helix domain-containing protein [Solirubrobacteraceae bacterium]|nr:winged helix-turn-helix domain-containing protein [Solirubrobacteraceae bacterium]
MQEPTVIEPVTSVEDPRYVKALSHPLRIRILAILEEQQMSPVQLAARLHATLGTVAYHVRTLEQLGLVELVATHQRRGATEHVFAARPHPRISDEAWASASPIAKQALVSSVLAQAGQYATQSAARGGFDRAQAQATRTAMRLDETAWNELAQASKRWLAETERIEQAARTRVQAAESTAFDVGLVLLLFEAVPFSQAAVAPDGASADGHRDGSAPDGASADGNRDGAGP